MPAPTENGKGCQISNFEGLMIFTLTLDWVILHTVVHHSSNSTYTPNFIKTEEMFCGWTDVHTHVRMDGQTFETGCHRESVLYEIS